MTYRGICAALREAGVDQPERDAELLLEHFCGASLSRVLAEPERQYGGEALCRAVEERCRRVPLQYIIGVWDFYRQTYEVSPDCLIPRQDTEILVEEAVSSLPRGAFFADVCTGSGCIAVSVLAERRDTHALAVELSAPALKLAGRNAERNGVSERFVPMRADALRLSRSDLRQFPSPDAILSNPPYIRTGVLDTLAPEVRREPRMALDGGADGLRFYRALIALAAWWLKPEGFCLFEIGFDQAGELDALAKEGGFSCRILRDLGGCDRVAMLRRARIN